ncbi:MAG TPA: lytic transglycosylase domain-containing protein [Albitalea sp.]
MGAVMRRRLARAALLAFAAIAGEAAASMPAVRYLCQLTDGSTAVLAYDLSVQYGGAVARCEPLEAAPAQPEPLPLRPPMPRAFAGDRGRSAAALPRLMASPHAQLIADAARRYQLEPRLLMAVAQVESRHRADARSRKGALGIMQIMPGTGARYGVTQTHNLFSPEVNIDVGARYLSDLLDMFGRVDLALAAYNAGEGTVKNYGNRIPPFPETRRYVRQVMQLAGRAR